MNDDGSLLPTTVSATATSATASKRDSADYILFGRGRYKFWALAAILLLAFWSMFAGTVTLRWSAGNLNHLSDYDLDLPVRDDLDVLEMEEREKMVKHMWDVYTNSRRIQLPKFWQDAFEAAFEDLMNDAPEVKEAAITEIAKMSIRYIDSPPFSSTSASPDTVFTEKKSPDTTTLLPFGNLPIARSSYGNKFFISFYKSAREFSKRLKVRDGREGAFPS